jgi:hypothetical protein
MKTFKTMCAQGDLLIRRIDALPEGADIVKAENGKLVLAHSETGHDHIVIDRPEVSQYSFGDLLKSFLVVTGDEPIELLHERSFDTHESILINPGIYELRRQREYIPEGWRKAAD